MMATSALSQTLPPPVDTDYTHLLTTGTSLKIALVRNGNSADNVLGGTHLGDTFNGVKGDDMFQGYQGVDAYYFTLGDGADTIIDHSASGNRIKFRDVPEETVNISEVPGFDGETDRLITYGTSDAIRIVGWSRLSDATKANWTIEYFFSPEPAPFPKRPNSILLLLSDPLSLLLILACLAVGGLPLVKLLMKRS